MDDIIHLVKLKFGVNGFTHAEKKVQTSKAKLRNMKGLL